MTTTVKNTSSSDALVPLRTKVQTLRRQVPAMTDEDTWRSFLGLTTGGVTSTRAMTERQLRAVVDGLHKAGAPRVSPRGARSGGAAAKPRYAASPQLGKVRALWITLADAGHAIEALKAMARRKGVALES